jgi:hypothetical protein
VNLLNILGFARQILNSMYFTYRNNAYEMMQSKPEFVLDSDDNFIFFHVKFILAIRALGFVVRCIIIFHVNFNIVIRALGCFVRCNQHVEHGAPEMIL